jgi:hypothetical protein
MQHSACGHERLTIGPLSTINARMKTLPVTIIITCRIIIS